MSEQLKQGQVNELNKRLKQFSDKIAEINSKLDNPRSTTDKRLEAIKARINELLLPQYHFSEMIDFEYETKEVQDPVILKKYRKLKKEEKKDKVVTIDGVTISGIGDIPLVKVVTSIKYTVQEDNKQCIINKYYGKHLLVTDHDDWDTVMILNVYRDQEFVERFFRDSKNVDHFSVRPIYHWTDQKIRVHIMLCYLGLTLCKLATYLLEREQEYKITDSGNFRSKPRFLNLSIGETVKNSFKRLTF